MNFRGTSDLLAHLANMANYTNRKDEPEDEVPQDIDLASLKERALKEVRAQRKFERYAKEKRRGKGDESHTSHNQVVCTDTFMAFVNSGTCDDMLVAALYYVSSTFRLQGQGPELTEEDQAAQEQIQTDSFRVMSSLYCQLLLSPASADLRVREERIFYETIIFFLDACVCFALHTDNPDPVYELLGQVFRRDLQDPRVRRRGEFLPITEIVRRHWLSQRVPGKTRSEIAHSTLQGTTRLIEPLCQKGPPPTSRSADPGITDIWDRTGYPKNSRIPLGVKVLPWQDIIDLSPPKQSDN
jgi:hypothetical protein